jgi:hypothetical protein
MPEFVQESADAAVPVCTPAMQIYTTLFRQKLHIIQEVD